MNQRNTTQVLLFILPPLSTLSRETSSLYEVIDDLSSLLSPPYYQAIFSSREDKETLHPRETLRNGFPVQRCFLPSASCPTLLPSHHLLLEASSEDPREGGHPFSLPLCLGECPSPSLVPEDWRGWRRDGHPPLLRQRFPGSLDSSRQAEALAGAADTHWCRRRGE